MRSMLHSLRAVVVLFGTLVAVAARGAPVCEASPEVRAAIEVADRAPNRAKAFEALLAKYPDDVFVHQSYSYWASESDYARVRADYQARHDREPHEPRWTYLLAKLVSFADRKAAIESMANLDYPPAQLFVAQRADRVGDSATARRAIAAYRAACPDSIAGLTTELALVDKARRAAAAASLRLTLAGRSDADVAIGYRALWAAEFKTTPLAQHPALRRRVAADLTRLRGIVAAPDAAQRRVFHEGYEMTSDAAGKAWVKQREGAEGSDFFTLFTAWSEQNREPPATAPRQEREAYRARLFAASTDWVKRFPDDGYAWSQRLASAPAELPEAELRAIAGRVLGGNDGSLQVAAVYAERGIDLDQVPRLVERALAERDRSHASMRAQPERFRGVVDVMAMAEEMSRWSAHDTLSLVYRRLGDVAKLREVQERLVAKPPSAAIEASERKEYEATVLAVRARLAWAEQRKGDALALFLRAEALAPERAEEELPVLWKELGGTSEGWSVLRGSSATKTANGKEALPAGVFAAKSLPLPSLKLLDVRGRTWRSADWKGKTVLLVTWATWCEPCKAELPHLERLYQRLRGRKDVIVASLNVDGEVGLVAPFLKEMKYTFPVLLASEWGTELRQGGIPLSWVADRTFVVRLEKTGYDAREDWIKGALGAIEAVATGAPKQD